jgi:uncharacterized protein (DUF2336 family)
MLAAQEAQADAMSRARQQLIDRLCEVTTWPSSRISVHERDLAADLLVGLLASCALPARKRLAQRLAPLSDAPKPLLRYLSADHFDVAEPLLAAGAGMDDADLIAAIDPDRLSHARLIASRRTVTPVVTEALVALCDADVTQALLRNSGASLSVGAVDVLVRQSRATAGIGDLLAGRSELRAGQALVMFWWCDGPTRATLLRRYAVDRTILVGELGEVFLTAAEERWQDAQASQALLMVERRQRTRLDSKGQRAQLESAVAQMAQHGFDAKLVAELAHQTSLRPPAAVRIFKDPGGEPLAVWAKASGIRRAQFEALWAGLQGDAAFSPDGPQRKEQALRAFDSLATAKAQGVLRVWNWAIGAAAEIALVQPAKTAARPENQG